MKWAVGISWTAMPSLVMPCRPHVAPVTPDVVGLAIWQSSELWPSGRSTPWGVEGNILEGRIAARRFLAFQPWPWHLHLPHGPRKAWERGMEKY